MVYRKKITCLVTNHRKLLLFENQNLLSLFFLQIKRKKKSDARTIASLQRLNICNKYKQTHLKILLRSLLSHRIISASGKFDVYFKKYVLLKIIFNFIKKNK